MSDPVIRAEGLGKRYLIGHQSKGERYTTLREGLARGAGRLARSAAGILRGRPLVPGDRTEEFWALKDVSFEVRRGEVVGIIGRNGAGKSTLLKILSRITEPSAGRVTIKGRVASLLEVGTGFHPELTGRENIYLNGAILGMTRAESRRKFDEIVAFAEVERFLDTPVKRYSSGMYVRLAFAVAAHVEPEILVVDEVLAVGDAEFQRKCLGKMSEVAGGGRTVLFVSHNMGAVKALCNIGLLLKEGRVAFSGSADGSVSKYLDHDPTQVASYIASDLRKEIFIQSMEVMQEGRVVSEARNDLPIYVKVRLSRIVNNLAVGLIINRADGICVHHISDEYSETKSKALTRIAMLPPYAFSSGVYAIDVFVGIRNVCLYDEVTSACSFGVVEAGLNAERSTGAWRGVTGGGLAKWEFC